MTIWLTRKRRRQPSTSICTMYVNFKHGLVSRDYAKQRFLLTSRIFASITPPQALMPHSHHSIVFLILPFSSCSLSNFAQHSKVSAKVWIKLYRLLSLAVMLLILVKSLERYIDRVPYMSNAVITQLSKVNNLDELCDLAGSFLTIDYQKKKRWSGTHRWRAYSIRQNHQYSDNSKGTQSGNTH